MQGELSVSVDRDFARFGNKSYAINKINSVEVRARQPYGAAGVTICALVTLICLVAALNDGGASAITLAIIFSALTVWSWRRARIVEYQLFLMTSSSEAQAITSQDGDMIDQLRTKIERAMAGRLD